jgi:2,5-diketo-D-gluconate reductase B
VENYITASGVQIPRIGFGTWPLRGDRCAEVVREALRLGYRHIDTAQGYQNEAAVGEGLRASGVRREDVFITTKVIPEMLSNGPLQESVEQSLKRLQVDQVDLLLIHWPNPAIDIRESMDALSDAKRRGLTRLIGVSNFTAALLDEAVKVSPEKIVTNQIELHPYVQQGRVVEATRRHGLAITAYCPVAHGKVAVDPVLRKIGAGHAKTAAQVALRWLIQQGDVIAIPKASSVERLRENLDVLDFSLSDEEMVEIDAIPRTATHLVNEPQWVPRWD